MCEDCSFLISILPGAARYFLVLYFESSYLRLAGEIEKRHARLRRFFPRVESSREASYQTCNVSGSCWSSCLIEKSSRKYRCGRQGPEERLMEGNTLEQLYYIKISSVAKPGAAIMLKLYDDAAGFFGPCLLAIRFTWSVQSNQLPTLGISFKPQQQAHIPSSMSPQPCTHGFALTSRLYFRQFFIGSLVYPCPCCLARRRMIRCWNIRIRSVWNDRGDVYGLLYGLRPVSPS